MGRLYDIIQAHIDAQPYGVSVRRLAEDLGVSPTTVANWREPKNLPRQEHLEAIARVTGVSMREVFYAAGVDTGYINEPQLTEAEKQQALRQAEVDAALAVEKSKRTGT